MKQKSKEIDTIRLRELHTACMTVDEIAEKMGVEVSRVIYELEYLGYKPIYEKDKPEPWRTPQK